MTAQEMFKALGYEKDEYYSHEIPTYTDEYRSLMITEAGVIIISKTETVVPISLSSLSTEEIKAIYKQIEELKYDKRIERLGE